MRLEESNTKKGAFAEDDECWSIAESMVEEIEMIKGKKTNKLSADGKPKGNFKRMLMKRVKMAKELQSIGQ
jgi:hypothetical protein